jgi:hypothetical protein
MSTPSNLYAEKVFSEHPLALWPLDEKLDYVSLINNDQRDISDEEYWSIFGGSVESTSFIGPIVNSITKRVIGDEPESEIGSIILSGPELINVDDLDQSLKTFAIAFYLYSETSFVKSVDIGYQVNDEDPVFLNSKFTLLQTWRQVSRTFEIPQVSGQLKPVIKINYIDSEIPEQEYGFFVNGITVGQWSEQFSVQSLGVIPEEISSNISLPPNVWGVPINAYGQNTPGYYLGTQASLAARNFGVPLVFGSENVTTIKGNNDLPSIIVPGFGFLNRLGQFRNLTLEFWLKVNASTSSEFPIVKALGSSDGLYIDGPFLVLKINGTSSSHFVGEWGRPMLINIIVTNNFVSLLLNSEQVISQPILIDNINFAMPTDAEDRNQDWLGFFANDETGPIQIDCIGIYPYQVPEVLAKRRMVYAQAVDLPENTNASYISSSVNIDYAFANYANGYNYPDTGRWQSGILNNLEINRDVLSLPQYSLPSVIFDSNKSTNEWLEDLTEIQDPEETFYTLRPDSNWEDVNGYILFENLNNVSKQPITGFYGIFEKSETQSGTLVRIKDRLSNNFFEIVAADNKIEYKFFYNGTTSTVVSSEEIANDQKFICGIDIDKFTRYFGNNLAAFFGNRKNLQVYVGGIETFLNTFDGKIYSFHFFNRDNLIKIKFLSDERGVILSNDGLSAEVLGLNSVYTLKLSEGASESEAYRLSIASSASWQDYVPLTVLAKTVKNAANEDYYSLDFVQINFDYPRTDKITGELYDTSKEFLRAYITFQPLDLIAYRNLNDYTYAVSANKNGVVEPGSYVVDTQDGNPVFDSFTNTKYEIVSGMIVYPPATIARNRIAIAVHFEFNIPDIHKYPIKIKNLELASLALNDIAENPIGTASGVPIFPYTKLNIYFDYKKRNPFEIYKGTTPYLHLTKNSGIRLRGGPEEGISRGISMPINQGKSSNYTVGALQFAFRHDDDVFPSQAVELFEIESANEYIKFYLTAADSEGKRGRIYAINTATGAIQPGMAYYLNGILQRDTIIDNKQWFIMGLQFINPLVFNNFVGAFRSTGPILVNNVYHYQYTAFEEIQAVRTRSWLNVLNTADGTAIWEDYEELTWLDVLFILTTEKPSIDPGRLYRVYTGTNKFIVGDDKIMTLNQYQYKAYTGITWDTRVVDPV